MEQTVAELIKISTISKIWLCPHIVHRPTFRSNTILRGIECTKSTVPEKLLNCKVRKHFKEGGFLCIVWYNPIELEDEIKTEEENLPDDDKDSKAVDTEDD